MKVSRTPRIVGAFCATVVVAVTGLSAGQMEVLAETARAVASDVSVDDRFGTSVALDGNRMAVGSTGEDTGNVDAGTVYVLSGSLTALSKKFKRLSH